MTPSLCLQDLATLFAEQPQRHGAALDAASLSWRFEHICTDSRALQPGDLFIPLQGEHFDGHDFLDAAVAVGVAGAIVNRSWSGYIPDQLAIIKVDDTLAAYQRIALAWRRQLELPVVAVTGSAGKTTTRELIKACLKPLGPLEASIGNENNDIGVPRTILRCSGSHRALVLEMGMRGLGEIERLSVCSEPNVAVITNIGTAHIGRLGSRQAIATAKCEITTRLHSDGLVVIPAGDELLETALASIWKGRVCRVALNNDQVTATLPPPDWHAEVQGDQLNICAANGRQLSLRLPLQGRHNARNFLLAIAVADALGVELAQLTELDVKLPGGRSRRISLEGALAGVSVLDETYNASPEAMLASLELLSQQKGRQFAVLGTMLELGDQSAALHRTIGERAAELKLNGLVVVAQGTEAEAMLAGASSLPQVIQVNEPKEAAMVLKSWLKPGDHLLLKASRGVALEELIPLL